MKKLSLISLSILGIGLVACGKESDFKKAINAKLSSSPECLSVYNSTLFSTSLNSDDFKKFKDKNAGAFIVEQKFDKNGKQDSWNLDSEKQAFAQFDALTAVGLLTKSTESLPTYDWNKKADGGYNLYTVYSLTEKGKATAAKVETNGMAKSMFGDNGNRIFCYATPEVVKIENYTEGDGFGGVHFANVKYSYQYSNIADWASNTEVKAAFTEISKTLDNPNKVSSMNVIKTNNGWSTKL